MARWALVTAEKGVGKGPVILEVAERLREAGIRVGGFLQLSRKDAEGLKTYEVARVGREERVVLAVEGIAPKGETEESFCTYAFRNESFDRAREWIEQDAPSCQVLVLDDVSKLEAMGKGHAASLRLALGTGPGTVVLIGARSPQLSYVMEAFGLDDEPVGAVDLPGERGAIAALAEAIAAVCRATAPGT